MKAVILSVGTELVTGQCVDTNSAWLSAELTPSGIEVVEHLTVGDDVPRLEAAIRKALDSAELVLITGGLGPTADDITREGIARAIGAPLEENAEALTQIGAFFDRWQRPMPESNKSQALLPKVCTMIPNRRGTAPGVLYTQSGRLLAAFPGVPSEMKPMFAESVVPLLPRKASGPCTRSARLLCFGISEAKLGETIADLMRRDRNPLVGTTATQSVLTIRILATAESEKQAVARLEADVHEARKRLGTMIFGQDADTLQSVVVAELIRRAQTVSTAESCTGGGLAENLTEIPGSSAVFPQGFVAYSNEAKVQMLGVPASLLAEHGGVSEPVARAMAIGCRSAAKSDFALSITGIAGPDGGRPPEKPIGLVFIALADARACSVHRFLFGDHLSRQEVRDRARKSALNLLRLRLTDMS